MKTITHKEFVALLTSRPGVNFIGIVAETDARPLKTGNPYSEIRKVTAKSIVTGSHYNSAVERQGGENFEAGKLPYGKWIIPHKVLITDSGDLQLRTQVNGEKQLIAPSVQYYADGFPVDKSVVAQWLPKPQESAKQLDAGVSEGKTVRPTNYSFKNIREIHMDKEKYSLIPG